LRARVSDHIAVLASEHRDGVTSKHAINNRQRSFVYNSQQTADDCCQVNYR